MWSGGKKCWFWPSERTHKTVRRFICLFSKNIRNNFEMRSLARVSCILCGGLESEEREQTKTDIKQDHSWPWRGKNLEVLRDAGHAVWCLVLQITEENKVIIIIEIVRVNMLLKSTFTAERNRARLLGRFVTKVISSSRFSLFE